MVLPPLASRAIDPRCLGGTGGGASCEAAFVQLNRNSSVVLRVVPPILLVLPGLAGMFVGAPLIARELEQRTHSLAWTQSVTRGRWLAVKLALLGAGVALSAALLGGLTLWWAAPLRRVGAWDPWTRFDIQGVVPVAHALFAFALGVAAGAITRRTVAAIAATLGGFALLRTFLALWARPRFQAPLAVSMDVPLPRDAWVLGSFWVDAAGHKVPPPRLVVPDQEAADFFGALARRGFYGRVAFQPAERFWSFQAFEAGIFVAAALLLLALTVWWVLRRAA